jgi:hypothetical protein
LYLAVLPACVGFGVVVALAYWGERSREAPGWFVAMAALATLASVVLAWRNTRYVARRLEDLLGRAGPRARAGAGESASARSPLRLVRELAVPRDGASLDEIDSIRNVVGRLSTAVTTAEADGDRRAAAAAERVHEYAALLAETTAAVARHLDEVRLPLHILLENHFGEINENQEEMLGAARAAADAAAQELGRLHEIAELDRGALSLRRETIRLADVLRGLEALLQADAERRGATFTLEIPRGAARVAGDRLRLQEAFERLLRHVVSRAEPGEAIAVTLTSDDADARVEIRHAAPLGLGADPALARRILGAHGGNLIAEDGLTVVTLPKLRMPATMDAQAGR